ncbi:carboxypeptidase-like regulatory domain-containing protein [Variovorax terrae]|uniref:Carboxypeptidase-like regulatory domain-containing protein n=1 Tax=Variovorax terrae TaxID=2923278 RepID=A0A9X1VXM0_9BURK|nr:carboxypeptidase-like regulatory domain-containing protein [Variovorax terrae]MCJ0765656.1 carboxypeptidase-like regulatory domain-containing protein [Variovorax terrae]
MFHRVATRPLLAAFCLMGGALLGPGAHAAGPPPHSRDGVEFMSGGIGQDQARLMEEQAPHWPATLEFAVQDHGHSAFAANVHVTVRQAGHDEPVLRNVTAEGPFLMARLAPGHYEVEATLAGQTLRRTLTVQSGKPSRALFLWPAGTDMGAPS